jgi:serine/threonine protein kinase
MATRNANSGSFILGGPASSPATAGAQRRGQCQTEIAAGGHLENDGITYNITKQLGTGCFAEVFKAEASKGSFNTVAIKIMPETSECAAQLFRREAQRLEKLKHENIVRAIDTFRFVGSQSIYTCIVLEFCEYGSIFKYIRSKKTPFMTNTVLSYTKQIASGQEYMHKRGIIHGDFKSDNILISNNGHVKISDFGHSRRFSRSTNQPPMRGGDMMYAPPEFDSSPKLDTKFDMWGFGCIVSEMSIFQVIPAFCQGVPLFKNQSAMSKVTEQAKQAHNGLMWPLISSLFSQSAASRPSASEVRSRVEALESRRNSGADGEDGPGLLRKSSSTILKMLGKKSGTEA